MEYFDYLSGKIISAENVLINTPHNLILHIDILPDLHFHDLEQGFGAEGVEGATRGEADGLTFGDGKFVAVEFDVTAAVAHVPMGRASAGDQFILPLYIMG